MTTRPPSLQLGALVGGKYRLLKKIGEGGHGRVYRAINTLLGREVAIKVLKPELVGDETAKKRFFREAKTANLVRHPNVVDVLDVGDSEDGPWMVQELLVGEPLSAVLSREGTLTVKHAIDLLLPVLGALAIAHARGIAHRDFKPENVFLERDEDGKLTPKILDFGLSKSSVRFGATRESDRITGTGVVVGTPAYLAPERVRMESEGDVRADVWAIGVVLYECTTGFLPFPARTVREMFIQISNGHATPIEDVFPEVDPNFATIVMRCLRKDPEQRYPSAAEIEEDIRRYQDGLSPDVTQRHALVQLPPETISATETAPEPEPAGKRVESPTLIETSSEPLPLMRAAPVAPIAAQTTSGDSSSVPSSATTEPPPRDASLSQSDATIEPVAPSIKPRNEDEEPSATSRIVMVVLAVIALAVVVAIWRSSQSQSAHSPSPRTQPAPVEPPQPEPAQPQGANPTSTESTQSASSEPPSEPLPAQAEDAASAAPNRQGAPIAARARGRASEHDAGAQSAIESPSSVQLRDQR